MPSQKSQLNTKITIQLNGEPYVIEGDAQKGDDVREQ